MSLSRKAINFDLSTNELKKHFSNTAEAYNRIKSFMLENGFEHRQYSGYVSVEAMEDYEIAALTENLNEQFSWLSSCAQRFDVTDIGEQHDLMYLITKTEEKDKIQLESKAIKTCLDKIESDREKKRRIL